MRGILSWNSYAKYDVAMPPPIKLKTRPLIPGVVLNFDYTLLCDLFKSIKKAQATLDCSKVAYSA